MLLEGQQVYCHWARAWYCCWNDRFMPLDCCKLYCCLGFRMLIPYKIGRGYFAGKIRLTYRRSTKLRLTYRRHFEISALFSKMIRNNNQIIFYCFLTQFSIEFEKKNCRNVRVSCFDRLRVVPCDYSMNWTIYWLFSQNRFGVVESCFLLNPVLDHMWFENIFSISTRKTFCTISHSILHCVIKQQLQYHTTLYSCVQRSYQRRYDRLFVWSRHHPCC